MAIADAAAPDRASLDVAIADGASLDVPVMDGPRDGSAPPDAALADLVARDLAAGDTSSGTDGRPPGDATEDPPAGSGRWETRAMLLELNSECAVAELQRRIYVVGGYPGDRVSVATVQVYDVDTNSWRRTTPLPLAVNHTVAAAANGRLYVMGGQTSSSGTGPFLDDVFEFDPTTERWTRRAPMPTRRGGGAAVVVSGIIYVAGGRPPQGRDFASYDPVRDAWEVLPPMPTGRNHLAVGSIDGRIYVAGGRFEAGFTSPHTAALEVYDPVTRRWSTRAPMPTSRSGVNGIAAGGCFYVWGGEAASGLFPQNEVYHAATDRWRSLAPLPTPVHGITGAAYLDGIIYAPGGGTAVGGSSGSRNFQVFLTAGTCPSSS